MTWRAITTLHTPFSVHGREFHVQIEGEERADGTWGGRVVFLDGKTAKQTLQETSQPNRQALEYWATGLEAVYLEGAFGRAKE
jgi:hypothetical protein